jgi:hypothetical protein
MLSLPKTPFAFLELRLKNFRGFENARLILSDLTILVGPNGVGKSTLLEGFDFLKEAVTDSLRVALERRGGLAGIRRRKPGRGNRNDVVVSSLFSHGATRVTMASGWLQNRPVRATWSARKFWTAPTRAWIGFAGPARRGFGGLAPTYLGRSVRSLVVGPVPPEGDRNLCVFNG